MITEQALARACDIADCIPETTENFIMLRTLRRVLNGQEENRLALSIRNTHRKEETPS